MAVRNHDTAQGDGVAIGSPKLQGRVVVLPEQGDATDWHSYKDGQVYTVTALAHFHFRREVRRADGSSAVEEYDCNPGPPSSEPARSSTGSSTWPSGRRCS